MEFRVKKLSAINTIQSHPDLFCSSPATHASMIVNSLGKTVVYNEMLTNRVL